MKEKNAIVGFIVGLVVTTTIIVYKSRHYNKLQKNILLPLLVFPPAQWLMILIFWIYNKRNVKIIGFKIDKYNSSLLDLEKLKQKKILTNEEFNVKSNLLNEKIKDDLLKNSDDYITLLKLKNNGILTSDEFENKVDLLSRKLNLDCISDIEVEKPVENKEDLRKEFSVSNNIMNIIILISVIILVLIIVSSF